MFKLIFKKFILTNVIEKSSSQDSGYKPLARGNGSPLGNHSWPQPLSVRGSSCWLCLSHPAGKQSQAGGTEALEPAKGVKKIQSSPLSRSTAGEALSCKAARWKGPPWFPSLLGALPSSHHTWPPACKLVQSSSQRLSGLPELPSCLSAFLAAPGR